MPPDILPGLTPWLSAFWELSTDRRVELGPIPSESLRAWPVEPDEAELFRRCIRAMDRAYLAHHAPKKDGPGVFEPGSLRGDE